MFPPVHSGLKPDIHSNSYLSFLKASTGSGVWGEIVEPFSICISSGT